MFMITMVRNGYYFRFFSSLILLLFILIGHILVRPMPGEISINPTVISDDGIWYAWKSLTILGENEQVAADKVINWWNDHREMYDPPFSKFEPQSDFKLQDKFYGHRVIYPLLSALFVKYLGFFGLLVIPIFSFSAIWLLLTKLLIKKDFLAFYFPLVLLAGSSHYVPNIITTAGTDSVLSLLILFFIYSCVKFWNDNTRLIFYLNFTIFIGMFTRPSIIYWIFLSLIFIIVRHKSFNKKNIYKFGYFATLFLNIFICYYYIELTWNSFSIVKQFKDYPTDYTISAILDRIFTSLSKDALTLITKDVNLLFMTLLTLSLLASKIRQMCRKMPHKVNLEFTPKKPDTIIIAFTIAVFLASVAPLIFFGLGGVRLRFYLTVFPLVAYLSSSEIERRLKS